MYFNYNKFFSFLLFFGGCMGVIVATVAAMMYENWLILLWLIPATVLLAAGLAILD